MSMHWQWLRYFNVKDTDPSVVNATWCFHPVFCFRICYWDLSQRICSLATVVVTMRTSQASIDDTFSFLFFSRNMESMLEDGYLFSLNSFPVRNIKFNRFHLDRFCSKAIEINMIQMIIPIWWFFSSSSSSSAFLVNLLGNRNWTEFCLWKNSFD